MERGRTRVARLVYDTFPKSGTAWLGTALRHSFPNDEIAWTGHRRISLKKEENVITVIRNPLDTVSSGMVFFGYEDATKVLDWYSRFTQGIIESSNRIFIAKFEELTTDPNSIMTAYAKKFNLVNPVATDKELIWQETQKTHPAHLPSEETEARTEAKKMTLASPLLEKANELYEQAFLLADKGTKS